MDLYWGDTHYLGRMIDLMKQHTPIHWGAHVSCAIAAVTALSLLLISDLMHAPEPGRWGVLSGLTAAVIASAIISDRCLTKMEARADERTAVMLAELEAMMARHAAGVSQTYEDQTEVIAHAVCDAVMDVFDNRRAGISATPIQPRR